MASLFLKSSRAYFRSIRLTAHARFATAWALNIFSVTNLARSAVEIVYVKRHWLFWLEAKTLCKYPKWRLEKRLSFLLTLNLLCVSRGFPKWFCGRLGLGSSLCSMLVWVI